MEAMNGAGERRFQRTISAEEVLEICLEMSSPQMFGGLKHPLPVTKTKR